MRWTRIVLWLVMGTGSLQPLAADELQPVPFRLLRGYVILVKGSIGDIKNLTFLVDTGAVPSVVDARVAAKFGLEGQIEPVSLLNRQLDARRAAATAVRLGPLYVQHLPVLIHDLSFIEEALDTRVDAIVGYDFLGQAPFTIDYGARKIFFGPIDPLLVTAPYRPGLPYVVVELCIQGRTLAVVVDTGASDLVLFEGAVLPSRAAIITTGARTWSNLGGEVRVRQAQLRDAFLGAVSWGDRVAFLLEDDNQHPAGLAGLLGTVALRSKRVAFDPQRKIVAWEQKKEAARAARTP